jgi:hypothetical protein
VSRKRGGSPYGFKDLPAAVYIPGNGLQTSGRESLKPNRDGFVDTAEVAKLVGPDSDDSDVDEQCAGEPGYDDGYTYLKDVDEQESDGQDLDERESDDPDRDQSSSDRPNTNEADGSSSEGSTISPRSQQFPWDKRAFGLSMPIEHEHTGKGDVSQEDTVIANTPVDSRESAT